MRFIGCKTNLLDFIEEAVKIKKISGKVFCDLFAGTGSVGKRFKKLGYKVISNDILYFSFVLQKTYIELNEYPQFDNLIKHIKLKPQKEDIFSHDSTNASEVIAYLNSLDGIHGFIYNNYSDEGSLFGEYQRRFYTGKNASKIDAIRQCIQKWYDSKLVNDDEFYFLVCSLIEAVPFVSNISGTYAAFLKTWDKRAFKELTLELPILIPSNEKCFAYNLNGIDLLDETPPIDILYLDPPYNERQYAPNYHILETIARWDNPIVSGVSGLRPYSELKSEFCKSKDGLQALENILKKVICNTLLLSYNNEGIMKEDDIIRLFNEYGKLEIIEKDYQRYKSNSQGKQNKKVIEKLYCLHVNKESPNHQIAADIEKESKSEKPKRKMSELNKLNDMTGGEWTYFLNSVEVTHYSTKGVDGFAHHLRKKHPSPKPPQLMKKFIEFFTKSGQVVLDPFMGVGGTLIGCSLSNRKGIGIDLSSDFIDVYKSVCLELGLDEQRTFIADSYDIEKLLDKDQVIDFILTDPPYGNMLSKKRTATARNGSFEATPFTEYGHDLGNMEMDVFLESLKTILEKCVSYLKPKGYLAVFVKDMQPNGKDLNMLHYDIANKLIEIPSLSFRGYKIWYDSTLKLYPFGYPHAYVSNQFHQFIVIFRKEEKKGK